MSALVTSKTALGNEHFSAHGAQIRSTQAVTGNVVIVAFLHHELLWAHVAFEGFDVFVEEPSVDIFLVEAVELFIAVVALVVHRKSISSARRLICNELLFLLPQVVV